MIVEIYIDMDGVIADFHRRYNELFDSEAREDYLVSNNKKKDFFHKRFDEFVSSGQFATLDTLPDAHLGLEFVSGLGIPRSSRRKRGWMLMVLISFLSSFRVRLRRSSMRERGRFLSTIPFLLLKVGEKTEVLVSTIPLGLERYQN